MKTFILTLVSDTLKKDGKFSRTSLTMFTAWSTVLYISLSDYFSNGFRSEVFFGLLGVATGVKIVDATASKLKSK